MKILLGVNIQLKLTRIFIFLCLILNLNCSKKQFEPSSIVNTILDYEKDKELSHLHSIAKLGNYNLLINDKFMDIKCVKCDTVERFLGDLDLEMYKDIRIEIDTLKYGLRLYSEYRNKNEKYNLEPFIRFSYPLIIDENMVYIEVNYHPFGGSKLYAYKLKRQNNNWSIVSKKLLSRE
jgi:hypothetical protein